MKTKEAFQTMCIVMKKVLTSMIKKRLDDSASVIFSFLDPMYHENDTIANISELDKPIVKFVDIFWNGDVIRIENPHERDTAVVEIVKFDYMTLFQELKKNKTKFMIVRMINEDEDINSVRKVFENTDFKVKELIETPKLFVSKTQAMQEFESVRKQF